MIAIWGYIRNSELVFAYNWTDPHISRHSLRIELIIFELCDFSIVFTWRWTILSSKFWLVFSQELIFIYSIFLIAKRWLFLHKRVPEIFSFLIDRWCNKNSRVVHECFLHFFWIFGSRIKKQRILLLQKFRIRKIIVYLNPLLD